MKNTPVYEKIKESLDSIFAFSLKRTNDRYEAEDLSQEIVMNLYNSAPRLSDINKYYGWMWAVAENVFKAYLRKKAKTNNLEFTENIYSSVGELIEDHLIDREQVRILYRELSILSGLYRETMKLYYIHDKSCEEIAQNLDITVDMVKQYLFKSRKKIKEGMNMIRESGERSFNPRKFNIYYWGTVGNYCNEIFKRKLPGNIMLEAYYEPVTIEELSLELGVATVYLEDEVNILENNCLLKKMRGNKIQSNIIILTKEFESELDNKTQDIFSNLACYLYDFIIEKESEIRSIGFKGYDMSKSTLLWQISSACLIESVIYNLLNDITKEMPTLSDGSQGYMWGLERLFGDNKFDLNIYRYEDKYKNLIRGVDFYIVENKIQGLHHKIAGDVILKVATGDTQSFSEYEEEELAKLIQKGYLNSNYGALSVNMPVFTAKQFDDLKRILKPAIERISSDYKDIMPIAEKMLKNYAPSFLQDQIPVITSLKQVEAFITNTMNSMYLNQFIELPKPCNEILSTFVILTDK